MAKRAAAIPRKPKGASAIQALEGEARLVADVPKRPALQVARNSVELAVQSAGNASKAAAEAIVSAASSTRKMAQRGGSAAAKATVAAARSTAKGVRKASAAVSATVHEAADLTGDGRFDAADIRVAKAAAGKVARHVGAEAAHLAKSTLKHPVVKDAAAGALVGGVIAAGIPFVGVPLGAALGATAVAAKSASNATVSAAGDMVAKGADRAAKAAKAQLRRKSSKRGPARKTKPK